MESRLPKPKFSAKKTTSSISIATESVLQVPEPEPTTLKDMGKSKSGESISKVTKENKPPPSKTLSRARTVAAISRANTSSAVTKTAVKRPGPVTNAVAPKKPAIRPAPKTSATNTTVSSKKTVSGKSLKPTTAPPKPLPTKVSKWDWKTKFEMASKDLTTLKEAQKEMKEQREELQSIIDGYKNNEIKNNEKINELINKNDKLSGELTELRKDIEEITEKYGKTTKELENLQVTHIKTTEFVKELQNRITDLQNLCHEMDKDRRVLHNTIQEMKGNIRVFCRVRPRIEKEMSKNVCAINYVDESTLEISRADGSNSVSCSGKARCNKQEFSFDKVFPPTATQADIFEELSLLVQSALEGYNVCVFAYGQTGSGKTYTMEGCDDPELEGMIPRTVRHIFVQMKEFELLGWEYKIEASFLEIYNEHIVDLLDSQQKIHEIRMVDSRGTDLYVTNLQIEEIHNPEELHSCLRMAQQNRAVAATKSNERSSRSHSVARIRLIGTHKGKGETSIGNLNLVDLAGSERLRGEEAARTAETKNINKSLANLGNVILALLKKQDHIPYRNSKLTHLLMPSLGGNSKTLMLLNVSPLDDCYNETLNSLRFASNVNSCKLGNIKRSKTMIQNKNI
ncbi:protein claret segregational-like isoform X4 [Chelonus insularis]|uniref:protein claret segregational-like isoform X2 n=1 Tax=Chelonus insularis TaxID=460826 RepID=UPI0015882C99|nr:protein claret segregational-like isoform X2 [Chelonus insularis]XP_034949523.1 protein claret segregational-like isoform X4 [Chelonus insularis]